MTTNLKPSELLWKAQELLGSAGWQRKSFGGPGQGFLGGGYGFCALGAINYVVSGVAADAGYTGIQMDHPAEIAIRALVEEIRRAEDITGTWVCYPRSTVVEWNDWRARDRRDVQRKMRKASRRLAKEGK